MTAYEILEHDMNRVAAEYENCKEEVADCAVQIAKGDYTYCDFIKSAISKMEKKKVELDSLKSALATVKKFGTVAEQLPAKLG